MNNGPLIAAMLSYLHGNRHEIEHFLKVHGYAKAIGELEGLDPSTRQILEVAAIVHDIGIPRAIEKYGNDAGPYQEELGPAEAKTMLEQLGYDAELIDRVCTLVGRHHTYTNVDGPDCRILLEADYLVNASSHNDNPQAVAAAKAAFFRTETGVRFLDMLFGA